MKEKKTNIEELISLYLTGDANNEEIVFLKNWIKESEENYQYYTQLKTTWLLSNEGKNPHQFNTQKALQKFKQKTKNKQRSISVFIRYAAIFVIALGLGGYIGSLNKTTVSKNEEKLAFNNEAEAPYGVRSKVNLPDGSQVWLNSGSRLYFPSLFTGNTREVQLIGEGYFDVESDPQKPFVVNANGIIIKALGTSFNVKSYPDEPYVETTLVEGKVLVTKENSNTTSISLQPNQKVTIYRNDGVPPSFTEHITEQKKEVISRNVVLEKEVNTKKDISWRDDLWIIEDETLATLAKKLERRYNIDIEFKDSTMLRFRYSGTIKDEPVDKVLKVLTLTSPLTYTRDHNKIVFDVDNETKNRFKDSWQF